MCVYGTTDYRRTEEQFQSLSIATSDLFGALAGHYYYLAWFPLGGHVYIHAYQTDHSLMCFQDMCNMHLSIQIRRQKLNYTEDRGRLGLKFILGAWFGIALHLIAQRTPYVSQKYFIFSIKTIKWHCTQYTLKYLGTETTSKGLYAQA